MEFQAKWIRTSEDTGGVCPVFRKEWKTEKEVERATLYLTALGVYEAHLNGKRVGNYVLAPGWTAYDKRLQYQEYDITDLVVEEMCIRDRYIVHMVVTRMDTRNERITEEKS